jgi:hypothetical protein
VRASGSFDTICKAPFSKNGARGCYPKGVRFIAPTLPFLALAACYSTVPTSGVTARPTTIDPHQPTSSGAAADDGLGEQSLPPPDSGVVEDPPLPPDAGTPEDGGDDLPPDPAPDATPDAAADALPLPPPPGLDASTAIDAGQHHCTIQLVFMNGIPEIVIDCGNVHIALPLDCQPDACGGDPGGSNGNVCACLPNEVPGGVDTDCDGYPDVPCDNGCCPQLGDRNRDGLPDCIDLDCDGVCDACWTVSC